MLATEAIPVTRNLVHGSGCLDGCPLDGQVCMAAEVAAAVLGI